MAAMPIHPLTGMQAIGFTRRGPIWPVMGGSTDGGANNDGGNDNGGSGNGGAGGNGGNDNGKSFTQDDVTRIVESRLAQERNQVKSKYGNLDELLTAKTTLEDLQNKGKPEVDQLRSQLAAAQTAKEAAESRASSSDVELLKFRVASGVEGFPIAAVSRLQGTTEDEIKADAEKFLADFGGVAGNQQQQGPRPPKPNSQQGHSSDGGDADKSVSAGADLYARMHPKKSATQ